MTALDKDHAAVAKRLAEVQARIAGLNVEVEDLKDRLRELEPGDWADTKGVPLVRITAQRRFSLDAAVALVPEGDRAACLSVEYDPDKVKGKLTQDQIDACMLEYGKRKVGLL